LCDRLSAEAAVAAKITIVGGGSTHWTPVLLCDFANTKSLTDAEVVLCDIDAGSLPAMCRVGEHIARARQIDLRVTSTTDLDDALDGAKFVISAFSVGGFASMEQDIELPARYGILQPVGDTVGPGGIFRSLRSVPVMLEMARVVERRAPQALMLNVSNPLTALTRAVTKETSVRTVGLCNELVGFQFWISLVFDVPMHEVDPTVGGVNHLPLVTGLRIGSEDGFELLRRTIEDPSRLEGQPVWMDPPEQSHWHKLDPSRGWTKADVFANQRLKLEVFKAFGVLPGASDTHVAEFFPWFVTASSDFGRRWGVHHYGIAGHRKDKADDDDWASQLEKGAEVPAWGSGELAAPLIDALITKKKVSLPMNLPNTGQVAGLPEGVVVECIGSVEDGTVRPRDVTGAGAATEHLRRVVESQELTVQAALAGDRRLALQAMLADPVAGTLAFERVSALTDEMLKATSPWLPQFA
jgi:alpha-galactosidase/6-phospho-beta-glucosidase family protein